MKKAILCLPLLTILSSCGGPDHVDTVDAPESCRWRESGEPFETDAECETYFAPEGVILTIGEESICPVVERSCVTARRGQKVHTYKSVFSSGEDFEVPTSFGSCDNVRTCEEGPEP